MECNRLPSQNISNTASRMVMEKSARTGLDDRIRLPFQSTHEHPTAWGYPKSMHPFSKRNHRSYWRRRPECPRLWTRSPWVLWRIQKNYLHSSPNTFLENTPASPVLHPTNECRSVSCEDRGYSTSQVDSSCKKKSNHYRPIGVHKIPVLTYSNVNLGLASCTCCRSGNWRPAKFNTSRAKPDFTSTSRSVEVCRLGEILNSNNHGVRLKMKAY